MPRSTRRGARWTTLLAILMPAGVAHASANIVDVGPSDGATDGLWQAVNESGQLAGALRPPGNTSAAARWDNGTVTRLGSDGSIGHAIADDGTVLGSVLVPRVADYPAWWDGAGEH